MMAVLIPMTSPQRLEQWSAGIARFIAASV